MGGYAYKGHKGQIENLIDHCLESLIVVTWVVKDRELL